MTGAFGAAAADEPAGEGETQAELADLRARIEAVQERIEADRSERSDAEKRIETLDRKIADLAVEIRELETQQAAARGEMDRLDRRMAELRDRLTAQKSRVADLAYSTYVMGRQSHLKLFLNQQDPAVINRMMGYHDYILAARARVIGRINGWASEVATLTREQAERQDELDGLAARRQSEQEALQARRGERKEALAAVEARIASSQDELSRLKENEQQLKQILKELQGRSTREVAKGAFRRMRGKLRLPVSAPISAKYGQRRATGVAWDGIMFRPHNGQEVSAIFEGRVVFADWLRGFGLLLIIDHGDGFMSLYSHNETLFKQIGDWVDTGEVIATVGTSGGLDKPGLYFEIRQDGEPQNPFSWCQRA